MGLRDRWEGGGDEGNVEKNPLVEVGEGGGGKGEEGRNWRGGDRVGKKKVKS